MLAGEQRREGDQFVTSVQDLRWAGAGTVFCLACGGSFQRDTGGPRPVKPLEGHFLYDFVNKSASNKQVLL